MQTSEGVTMTMAMVVNLIAVIDRRRTQIGFSLLYGLFFEIQFPGTPEREETSRRMKYLTISSSCVCVYMPVRNRNGKIDPDPPARPTSVWGGSDPTRVLVRTDLYLAATPPQAAQFVPPIFIYYYTTQLYILKLIDLT